MERDQSSTEVLLKELEQFKKDQENVRVLVGQIGGTQANRLDLVLNTFFVIVILILFSWNSAAHFMKWTFELPPLMSIEIGVLLVSLKIIWMIHRQSRIEHFQFWILNSIEFRLNEIAKDIRKIQKHGKS